MKKYLIVIMFIVFFCYFYLGNSNLVGKSFSLISELGGGHYIYGGFGFDFAKEFSFFKTHKYFKSIGLLVGFTYLSEDSVYIYEPDIFITGEIINDITISQKHKLDIEWRLKAGKLYLNSTEHDIKGNAFSYGIDFLFKTFKYFYFDISVPIVSGNKGMEFSPCIGVGIEYKIF